MKRPQPYKDRESPLFKATPKWLYVLTGFRRTERDIWRANYGQRKYLVRYWFLWVFKVYEDCRVFGSCR